MHSNPISLSCVDWGILKNGFPSVKIELDGFGGRFRELSNTKGEKSVNYNLFPALQFCSVNFSFAEEK